MIKPNHYSTVASHSQPAVTSYRAHPLWERLAVRALCAAVVGKDPRRHIHRARIAARRAEFEQDYERAAAGRAGGAL